MTIETIMAWDLAHVTVTGVTGSSGPFDGTRGGDNLRMSRLGDATLVFEPGARPVFFDVDAATGHRDDLFTSSPTGRNRRPQLVGSVTFDGVTTVGDGTDDTAIGPIYHYTIRPVGGTADDDIRIYVVSLGDRNRTNVALVSDRPITIGESYSFVGSSSDPTIPYAQIASDFVLCFAAGTLIETPHGAVAAERLAPGDLVSTLDHGPQPLRWVGRVSVSGMGRFAPVLIRAGALGNSRDLRVSPQHRMLLRSDRAQLLFGAPEVLVAAHALVDGHTILRDPVPRIDYVHLMFDRHQIVMAEGIPSESFFPGAYVTGTNRALVEELAALFPEAAAAELTAMRAARPVLKPHEARVLRAPDPGPRDRHRRARSAGG